MKKIKIKVTVITMLLCILGYANFLQAQDVFRGTVIQPTALEQEVLTKKFKQQTLITFDATSLHTFVRQHPGSSSFRLQIGNLYDWNIDLQENEMRSPDFKAESTGDHGTVEIPRGECITYKGNVTGAYSGDVRLNIQEHRIWGAISFNEKCIYIEPLRNFDNTASFNKFVVYFGADVIPGHGTCGVGSISEKAEQTVAERGTPPSVMSGNDCRKIDVAAEVDWEAYNATTYNVTISDVQGNLNMVEGIYTSYFNAIFIFVYYHQWSTSNDPYSSTTLCQTGDRLGEFSSYWQSNFTYVERDINILYSGMTTTGSTAVGCALLGAFSDAFADDAYTLIEWYPDGVFSSLTEMKALVAHEVGHLFGANHDATDCSFTSPNGNIMCPTITYTSWSSPYFNAQAITEINNSMNNVNPIDGRGSLRLGHIGTYAVNGNYTWSRNEFNLDGVITYSPAGNVNIQATDTITFKPGFYTSGVSGSSLNAYIGPCDLSIHTRLADDQTIINSKQNGELPVVLVAPNPFKDEVKVSITLYNDAQVSIQLMDNMGRLIATIADNKQLQNGTQTVQVNTSNLPPGMYFIYVQTGENIITEKVVKM